MQDGGSCPTGKAKFHSKITKGFPFNKEIPSKEFHIIAFVRRKILKRDTECDLAGCIPMI